MLPIVSAILILTILLGASPFTYAVSLRYTTLPTLLVTTIPQDNQKLEKGIIILGTYGLAADVHNNVPGSSPRDTCTYDPTKVSATLPACDEADLMSQHKILVTYNGQPIIWPVAGAGVNIICNLLEKDKVNVVTDPKTGTGKQGTYENLMTKLVDVSDHFTCKVRWKAPAVGMLESAGVLDVYYSGVASNYYIADTILVVTATYAIGRSVVWGAEMQDICVLGWAIDGTDVAQGTPATAPEEIAKSDGTTHYIWPNAMGSFVGCEELALAQRDYAGILLPQSTDPLSLV
jgi:hypothetical protein